MRSAVLERGLAKVEIHLFYILSFHKHKHNVQSSTSKQQYSFQATAHISSVSYADPLILSCGMSCEADSQFKSRMGILPPLFPAENTIFIVYIHAIDRGKIIIGAGIEYRTGSDESV